MIINDTYLPYLHDSNRYLILYGGGGSGKSVFAAQKILLRVLNEYPHRFLCLRKVGNTIKESIFQEFRDLINEENLGHEFTINLTEKTFTHVNGNQIICKGLDEPEKIKSIKGITGMWIEEATEFTESDIDQLNIRIRGEKQNYVQYILSFNPIDADHFLKKKFIDSEMDDVTFVHTTYKENLFLSDQDRETLESFKYKNKLFYDVYCLGKWGIVDKSNKFAYNFDEETHAIDFAEYPDMHLSEMDNSLPLKLSFDFNVNPVTCIVGQSDNQCIRIFKSFSVENSDTEGLCDKILAWLPKERWFIKITGDRNGFNRNTSSKRNDYQIIIEKLKISEYNIEVPKVNPSHRDSQTLCNSLFQNFDIAIHAPECLELINDLKYVSMKEGSLKPEIDKKKHGSHSLDNFRYFCHTWHGDFLHVKY